MGKLYRWFYSRVRNRQDAEDLTNETFDRFIGAVNSGRQMDKPVSYLFAIARNCLYDHAGQNKARAIDLDEIERLVASPEVAISSQTVRAKKILQAILDAVSKLPKVQRDVMELRIFWRNECDHVLEEIEFDKYQAEDASLSRFRGASIKEIAEILRMSTEAVQRAYNRGLKTLRKVVDELKREEQNH
jgi:RNA polymerase sigma-70 factor (ECF subfamily)